MWTFGISYFTGQHFSIVWKLTEKFMREIIFYHINHNLFHLYMLKETLFIFLLQKYT